MDANLLKYGAGLAISIFVIKELFKLVHVIIKQLKPNNQNNGMDHAKATHQLLTELKEPFWEAKNKFDLAHQIITEKKDGIPLIYNKGLESSIVLLVQTITTLSTSIDNMSATCKKHQENS